MRAFNIANVLEQRGTFITNDRRDNRLVAFSHHVLSHRAVVHFDRALIQKKQRIRAALEFQLIKNVQLG